MILPKLKGIEEFPLPVQAHVTEFANKLLENFEDNVISIIVYGSAAGINYNPSVSNINMAVIVGNLDFSVLNQSVDLIKRARKYKMATPLFLTKEYILNALDVFPIEFSEIKEKHRVIFGDDLFKDLEIPRRDISLLCEQQVKGKLLHLRQAYLEIGNNPSVLKNILLTALNDLIPVFRQMIILKHQVPCEAKEEIFEQMANIFSFDKEPFLALLHDKHRKLNIASHQVEAHLQNFLNQLENLSRHMDSL